MVPALKCQRVRPVVSRKGNAALVVSDVGR